MTASIHLFSEGFAIEKHLFLFHQRTLSPSKSYQKILHKRWQYLFPFPFFISLSASMFTNSSHKGHIVFCTNLEYSLTDHIPTLSHESTQPHRFVKDLIHIYLHTIYFWSYTNVYAFYCLEGYLSFWISFKCLYHFNASSQACYFLIFWNNFGVWRLWS